MYYKRFFKRGVDIFGVFAGVILSSPVWVWLVPALAIVNHGKVFYRQQRVGKNGKMFRVVKFKTMTDRRDANGELLPDVQRLTPLGRWVRSFSFDELPQVYNVLVGDMSIVGPRPLLPEYLPLYSRQQMHRHDVRPGITGWAQCHGRNAVSWTRKFELDLWYVENVSLRTDAKIFFMTMCNVFARKDVNLSENEITVKFNGHN